MLNDLITIDRYLFEHHVAKVSNGRRSQVADGHLGQALLADDDVSFLPLQEQRAAAGSKSREQKKKCNFFYVNMLYFSNSLYLFVTISMYFLAIF